MRSSFSFPLISIDAPCGCGPWYNGEPSPAENLELNTLNVAEPTGNAEDARFMRLALALGRRGLGRTWPNPAVGAVVVKDGVIVGRGWTQPGGRPHAETEALRARRRRGARRHALRDARALLASRQDAALRRRDHRGRRRARGFGAGRSQSGGRGRRAIGAWPKPASWSRSASAPRRRGARTPVTSGACRTAGRT